MNRSGAIASHKDRTNKFPAALGIPLRVYVSGRGFRKGPANKSPGPTLTATHFLRGRTGQTEACKPLADQRSASVGILNQDIRVFPQGELACLGGRGDGASLEDAHNSSAEDAR